MQRRKILKNSAALVTMATVPAIGSAEPSEVEDPTVRPDELVLIKDDGEHIYYVYEINGRRYVIVVTKERAYHGHANPTIRRFSNQEMVTAKELQEARRRQKKIESSSGLSTQDVAANYSGPDIIERADAYQRRIGTCTRNCGAHWIEGVSMEFNKYVAAAGKSATIAAILAEVASVAGGTLVAETLNAELLSGAIGGTIGAFVGGNTLTLAFSDFDLNLVIGGKKLKNGGAAFGGWKPGPNQVLTYWPQGGHLYGCE